MLTIACFGDSLVYGFPFGNAGSWLAEASRQGGFACFNYGVCGACCDDIKEYLLRVDLPAYVRHILFLGGANDILQRRPLECSLEDIAAVVKWCAANEYKLCVALPLLSGDTGFNQRAEKMRAALRERWQGQALLLDLQPAIGFTGAELASAYLDSVHPKARTYKKIGEYAAPYLKKWLAAYD